MEKASKVIESNCYPNTAEVLTAPSSPVALLPAVVCQPRKVKDRDTKRERDRVLSGAAQPIATTGKDSGMGERRGDGGEKLAVSPVQTECSSLLWSEFGVSSSLCRKGRRVL